MTIESKAIMAIDERLLVEELILLQALALDELEYEFLLRGCVVAEPLDSVEVGGILPELAGAACSIDCSALLLEYTG